jgi:hypothetical protein
LKNNKKCDHNKDHGTRSKIAPHKKVGLLAQLSDFYALRSEKDPFFNLKSKWIVIISR